MSDLINIENKDGQLVVSSREVAKNFGKEHYNVLRDIENLIGGVVNFEDTPRSGEDGGTPNFGHTPRRDEDGVAEKSADPREPKNGAGGQSVILRSDLEREESSGVTAENSALISGLFIPSEYRHEQNGQIYREYLLTRDGFSLLVMGFTGAKALEWKLKYIAAFNAMEKKLTNMNNLSPELRLLINLELEQKQMQSQISQVNRRMDGIKEIVGLSVIGWREDAKALIVRIAEKWGGRDYIPDVNTAIYKELEGRLSVNLKQRRTNKRRRMAEEGASKTKQERVSYVDIIAEDKKLIEGYMAIVKEMAIKYGLADEKEA